MKKIFVRDENYEIVGTRIELEKNEWIKEVLRVEKELNLCKVSIKLINHSLDGKLSKKRKIYFLNQLKEFELKQQELKNKLEELKHIKTYDMFEETNLHATVRESIEFTPIISEEKKAKQKSLNSVYNLQRNKKRDTVMITLDQNDCK